MLFSIKEVLISNYITFRFVETPSTIYNAWENLIKGTEFDAQVLIIAYSIIIML